MRANVAHWDVADGTFEHQKFLELFVDLLFLMGDRIQPNFHPSEQQHGLQRNNLMDVTFGNNTFVAVGSSGTIVRSTDNGSSWDNATSPTSKGLFGVAFGNNTFVGVGGYGNIVRSTDNGSTWDSVTSPTGNSLQGVIYLE